MLDTDRLLTDLHAAAAEVDRDAHDSGTWTELLTDGMARAWRIVAAAIEDGEYDRPATVHQSWCALGRGGGCTCGSRPLLTGPDADWSRYFAGTPIPADPAESQDVEYEHCPRCGCRHQAPSGYYPLHHGCMACGWRLGDPTDDWWDRPGTTPTEEGGTVATTETVHTGPELIDLRPIIDLADHLERLTRESRVRAYTTELPFLADWYEGRAVGYGLAAGWLRDAVSEARA